MKIKFFSFLMMLICSLGAKEVEVAPPSTSIAREFLQPIGMPVVVLWHSMKENVFLNYARQDAEGFEALGDWLLTPYRYLLGGSDVISRQSSYMTLSSCNYQKNDGIKTVLSVLALPASTLVGSLIKGVSHLLPPSRDAYKNLKAWKKSWAFVSQNPNYLSQGIQTLFSNERAPCLHFGRPSKLSKNHQIELEALKEVCTALKKHDIVFWLDGGSALGAYRYQGMIPWDNDIDISIIAGDHENIKKLLETLDPDKYQIQDWSSYRYPRTSLKLYIKKTKTLIDIYHYTLDSKNSQASYFYTYRDTPLPRQWKQLEEFMTEPIPYAVMFPLKKAFFDGIEVWVPHDLEKFLHYKYGDDLSPTMIWNEPTHSYLKVKKHPYWQLFEQ